MSRRTGSDRDGGDIRSIGSWRSSRMLSFKWMFFAGQLMREVEALRYRLTFQPPSTVVELPSAGTPRLIIVHAHSKIQAEYCSTLKRVIFYHGSGYRSSFASPDQPMLRRLKRFILYPTTTHTSQARRKTLEHSKGRIYFINCLYPGSTASHNPFPREENCLPKHKTGFSIHPCY